MFHIVRTALLVTLATAPAIDVRQGPPGDLDVRTSRDTATGDTLTTLTLMLKGPKGPLPINLAITKRRKVKVTTGPPVEVRLDFDLRIAAGVADFTPPHAVFTLDKGMKTESSYPVSADPGAMLREATHLSLPSNMASLARLGGATTIEGTVLGVAFVLTAQQGRAISAFAT